MIIECPSCRSKYQYDEERFERKPSKKIKCARCREVFEIHNPAFAPSAPEPASPSDSTRASREQRVQEEPLPAGSAEPEAAADAGKDTGKPQGLALPTGKRLSLAILDGPDAGSVFRIEKPRITIGRSNADLTLNDSESSRQHAAIEVRDTLYMLVDLGSTNGTFCNGERISDPVELTDKNEFQVGTTTLMLIVTEDV